MFFTFIFTNVEKKNSEGRLKDRNVSDDYAGAAMGASILREKSEKDPVRVREIR